MKGRRRTPFGESTDPSPFDYTLLSHLYVHEDGSDVIDFRGHTSRADGDQTIRTLMSNKSFCKNSSCLEQRRSTTGDAAPGAFLCLHGDDDTQSVGRFGSPPVNQPQVVRIEDDGEHLWMVTQTNAAPYARMFSSPENLYGYIKAHNMPLPSRTVRTPAPADEPLPITKWIDMQVMANEPHASQKVSDLLSKFPLHKNTIDSCMYLVGQDYINVSHLTPHHDSYIFVVLACTPLTSQKGDGSDPSSTDVNATKSVMEMRFDAVENNQSRSSVPEPIAVAVIVFMDWIITIHESPFAEMDDLLRMIQLQCGPTSMRATVKAMEPHRFTSSLVFTSLLQIAVGHHIDSVALADAVDDLGNVVFEVNVKDNDQEAVLRRITAVRRCFGECAADVSRRENVVGTLLQPHLAHNFLLRDPGMRGLLENAQSHLRYVQHELTDCRDTVAVSNWYHNVALQWILLRRGNRALRMLLLLTEVANIMYPIITLQTLYSINVRVPYDSEGDPPSTSLVPFFVMTAIVLLYMLWCTRAVVAMFRQKRFQTRLLA